MMDVLRSKPQSWIPELDREFLHPFQRRRSQPAINANVLVAGAVVVGLGFLAWSYLGPDVRRYMKIHAM